jgi:hypothetical protein
MINVYAVFRNCKIEIEILELCRASNFIQSYLDGDTSEHMLMYLVIDEYIFDSVLPILKLLLSDTVIPLLDKTIIGENAKEYEVNYKFNDKGWEYIKQYNENIIFNLLLILDCLDVKSIFIAILDHISNDHKNYLDKIRAARYHLPKKIITKYIL